jgi:hypothetical protein
MNENTVEMQELHCHNCGGYVQFPIDLSMNGNYELACPNCGYIHCRVVENGIITDTRFDSRNGPTQTIAAYQITWTTVSASSTSAVYGISSSACTSDLWSRSYFYTAV